VRVSRVGFHSMRRENNALLDTHTPCEITHTPCEIAHTWTFDQTELKKAHDIQCKAMKGHVLEAIEESFVALDRKVVYHSKHDYPQEGKRLVPYVRSEISW
jgi:hypothetical protein